MSIVPISGEGEMLFRLAYAIFISLIPIAGVAQTFKSCSEALAFNSELAPLKDKIALAGIDGQTFQMKTNASKPSENEKKLIARWIELRDECWKNDIDHRNRLHPSLAATLNEAKRLFEGLNLDLYDGKITYGDYARRRDEIDSTLKPKYEEIRRNLQQQQQQEMAQRQSQQANQVASACDNARRNMDSYCGQSQRALAGNGGVTVNVGPNGGYQQPSGGRVDMQASFQCGYWQAETAKVCR